MDLRDAARRAARRDGLSLGQWLEKLMDERARSMGVTSADLGAEDCLKAVTDRLDPGSHRPASFRDTDRALAGFEAERQRSDSWRDDTARDVQGLRDLIAEARGPRTEAGPTPFGDAGQRRAAVRRDVAAAEQRIRSLERRDRTASNGSAPAAASVAVPQRSAIETRLNALFHALEQSTSRTGGKRFETSAAALDDAADPVDSENRLAEAVVALPPESASPTAAQTLLASTTLSKSRTLDQAIAEISQRQAMLGRPQPAPTKAERRPSPGSPGQRASAPAVLADVVNPVATDPAAGLFTSLKHDIARMSGQLDAMQSEAAQRTAPPAVPDEAFVEIRSMLDRMRPDQSIDTLERRVQDLTAKIDAALDSRVPAAAIEHLSQRIEHVHASLSDRLTATAAPAVDTAPIEAAVRELTGSVQMLQRQGGPDAAAFEALMHQLADRFEAERPAAFDGESLASLHAQVGKLADRIDRTDEGLTAIVSLERSLGELFSQMEETRDAAVGAAETAARTATRDTLRSAMSDNSLPLMQAQRQTEAAVEQVIHDVAEQRAEREAADQRLNVILDMLNRTLEKVVERLGAIESEKTSGPSLATARAPAPVAVAAAPVKVAAPVELPRAPEPPAAANPLNAARRARPVAAAETVAVAPPRRGADRAVATPVAPPTAIAAPPMAAPPMAASPIAAASDVLIEPGAVQARRPASKAPDVLSVAAPSASSGATDPASFIAAARRAAQTAAQASADDAARNAAAAQSKVRSAPANAAEAPLSSVTRAKSFIAGRRRPLLLAMAGIVMLIGAVAAVRLALAPNASSNVVAVADDTAPQVAAPASDPARTPASADATGSQAAGGAVAAAPVVATPVDSGAAPLTPVKPLPSLASVPASQTNAAAEAVPNGVKTGALASGLPIGLRNMAEDGSATAQYEVGLRFADGRGVTRDLKTAADWFEKAAKQGIAPAAYRLGSLYEKGLGVARDPAAAMQWYQTAADKGNIRAMHNLAVMSAEGSNGKSDYAKAATWFTKAAQAGVRDSQFNLAILYARGLGIEQSLSQSYTWFAIAAAQGDADATTKRDEVAARLDAKSLADAKKNVDNFQPAPTLAAANEVASPPGGWDGVAPRPSGSTSNPKASSKAHISSM